MEYLRQRLWNRYVVDDRLKVLFSPLQTHRESPQAHSPSPSKPTNEGFYLTQSEEMEEEEEEEEEFDMIQECVPIQFLENRIRTLSRTSVPYDLRCLTQHMENMRTFQASGEWDKLNAEQINASRTVQVGNLSLMDTVIVGGSSLNMM